MNKHFFKFIVFFILLSFGLVLPHPVSAQREEETLEAKIIEVLEEDESYQKLKLLITKGSLKDKEIIVESGDISFVNIPKYEAGDRVIVAYGKDFEGNDSFYITDFVRRQPLFMLFAFFIIVTALVAGWRGLTSLVGMAISFLVIFVFILPQISKGADPVAIAIIGSVFIIPASFYLSHGLNKKTTIAVIGTLIALIITGLLAVLFVDLAKLTGFASEEAGFLESAKPGTINTKGMLLAGIIIGVLGVLDDITVSQSAIVFQLKDANSKIKPEEAFKRAMSVGRDHISSMVNTLILVYTGAALPLLILFIDSPHPFVEVINYEIIADEVVRTLVGSIGLILAVPITTFIAALSLEKRQK